MPFCPDCGIDRGDEDLSTPCATCETAAKDTAADAARRAGQSAPPIDDASGIGDVNVAEAKALIEATETLEALDALEAAENERGSGPRVGVKKAIEQRRAALSGG